MSQQYNWPASSSISTNPSIGPNGAPIPTSATLVAGENPSLELQPLQTDASGNLLVNIATEPGTPLNVNVSDWGGVATTLGQKASAASVPVVIASDQSTLPVSDATTHTDLTTINTTLGSPFQAGGAISNTSFGATQPTASLLNATVVQSSGSNLHVDVDNFPATQPVSGTVAVSNFPATQPVSGTVSATQGTSPWVDNITEIGGSAISLGQNVSAASLPVVLASDQSSIPVTTGGNTPLQFVRNNYSSTNVTTAAYVQLIASTSGVTNVIETFDSSGQTMAIAFGASGSEVQKFLVFPGGNGRNTCAIPSGTRVSIIAISATASSGEFDLNLYT